jgi:hypothetical protein
MGDWKVSLETQDTPDFGKRANPNERYETPTITFNDREQVLLKALRKAVANGWTGWRGFVNDAVTLGMEPEGVLRDMRRAQAPIEPLIYNKEFAKMLWANPVASQPDWKYHLQHMILAEDAIRYLSEHVD